MSPRSVLATLVVMATVAACTGGSSSDGANPTSTTEVTPTTSTGAPTASSDPFLDRGPGSLVAALLPLRGEVVLVERGWQQTGAPITEVGPPCPELRGTADLAETYIDGERLGQVTIAISLFADERAAAAAIGELTDLTPECAAAWFAASEEIWSSVGLGGLAVEEPLGELVDPFVATADASTRLRTLESPLGPMTVTDTIYRDGPVVAGISVLGLGDGLDLEAQGELVAEVYRDQRSHLPIDPLPDPVVDDAIDRLRSVAAAQPTPPGYAVVGAVSVWLPDPDIDVLVANCHLDGSEPPTALGVTGPGWGAANNSTVFFDGWALADAEAAERLAADLANHPIVCDASADPGTFSVGEMVARMERRGDHELSIAEATLLPGSGFPIDGLRLEVVRVAVGSEAIGLTFLGIDGDQPDLVALAVDAADLLRARP